MAIKRCSESFTIWQNGAPVAFTVGQLIDDKHLILKTHSHLFADPETAARPAPQLRAVEQTTADPGERRSLAPPAPDPASGKKDSEPSEPFDPGQHTAPEVAEYLKTAADDEIGRVIAAEAAGQKRKGVLGLAPSDK